MRSIGKKGKDLDKPNGIKIRVATQHLFNQLGTLKLRNNYRDNSMEDVVTIVEKYLSVSLLIRLSTTIALIKDLTYPSKLNQIQKQNDDSPVYMKGIPEDPAQEQVKMVQKKDN